MSDEEKPLFQVGHVISTSGGNPKVCPHCGAPPEQWEVRNYSLIWHDGDVYCKACGGYVRGYDAG